MMDAETPPWHPQRIVCYYHNTAGGCWTENCHYLHLKVPANTCVNFWNDGMCIKGTQCKLKHVTGDWRQLMREEQMVCHMFQRTIGCDLEHCRRIHLKLPLGTCVHFYNHGFCVSTECRFLHELTLKIVYPEASSLGRSDLSICTPHPIDLTMWSILRDWRLLEQITDHASHYLTTVQRPFGGRILVQEGCKTEKGVPVFTLSVDCEEIDAALVRAGLEKAQLNLHQHWNINLITLQWVGARWKHRICPAFRFSGSLACSNSNPVVVIGPYAHMSILEPMCYSLSYLNIPPCDAWLGRCSMCPHDMATAQAMRPAAPAPDAFLALTAGDLSALATADGGAWELLQDMKSFQKVRRHINTAVGALQSFRPDRQPPVVTMAFEAAVVMRLLCNSEYGVEPTAVLVCLKVTNHCVKLLLPGNIRDVAAMLMRGEDNISAAKAALSKLGIGYVDAVFTDVHSVVRCVL